MKLVNFTADERVDLEELNELAQNTPLGFSQETLGNFATNPGAQNPAAVVQGFVATNPNGNQIQVSRGVAILGRRQGLRVTYGALVCDGDATQAIDVSAFEPGTYGVYVTYAQNPAAYENRTFWQPAGTPGEYADNVPTRLQANWSMTIVAGNPGAEWLQVAQLTLPGNKLVDTRPLYFEGRADQNFASLWGSDADRNANRGTAAVGDLQTALAALRTAIEDIKGPGLTRWWERFVGGQNIGFAGTAISGRTSWGDAAFFAQGNNTLPAFNFDAGALFGFDRGAQSFFAGVGGQNAMRLSAATMTLPGTLGVGAPATAALTVSAATGPQALIDAAKGAAAQLKVQAQNGTASVLFAAGGTASLFEQRATFGATLSFFDIYAQANLAARLDSAQRWIFGAGTSGYAQSSLPAAVSIADTSGNTLLRLDTSQTSGIAAAMSLRANNAATLIRFVPAYTSATAGASFMLQAVSTAFSLMDVVNGNTVFAYTPQNRVLDMSGCTPTARKYALAAGYGVTPNNANIYQWVVPAGSSARVNMPSTGGSVTIQNSGPVVFPLQVPQGATVSTIIVNTTRNTTSTQASSVAGVLYATPINAAGAAPAQALASFNITLQPSTQTRDYTLAMVANASAAGYQNFYVSFTDTDPNAVNQITALQYQCSVPQLPAGQA